MKNSIKLLEGALVGPSQRFALRLFEETYLRGLCGS